MPGGRTLWAWTPHRLVPVSTSCPVHETRDGHKKRLNQPKRAADHPHGSLLRSCSLTGTGDVSVKTSTLPVARRSSTCGILHGFYNPLTLLEDHVRGSRGRVAKLSIPLETILSPTVLSAPRNPMEWTHVPALEGPTAPFSSRDSSPLSPSVPPPLSLDFQFMSH
jgi:hypothetical protein